MRQYVKTIPTTDDRRPTSDDRRPTQTIIDHRSSIRNENGLSRSKIEDRLGSGIWDLLPYGQVGYQPVSP
jgi:hypothetical protein